MTRVRLRQQFRSRRAASCGFTLVELLVAFTLLALFVTGAFQVLSTGMRAAARTAEYAMAQTLARSRLAALAASPALEPGEASGRTALDGSARNLYWRTAVENYVLPGEETDGLVPAVKPLRAIVEVTWGDGMDAAPHRVELRALLLGKAR